MPQVPSPQDAMYPGGPENRLGNSIPVRPAKRFETKDKNIADPSDLTLDQNVKAPTVGAHIDEIVRAVGATGKDEDAVRSKLKTRFTNAGFEKEAERMPFFNPDVADTPYTRSKIGTAHPERPPFTGTPAEVYNSFKELGYDHDKSVEFSKKYMATMHEKYPEWADKFVQPGMSDKDEI